MSWLIKRGNIFYVGWNDGVKDRYESTRTTDPGLAEKYRLEKELAQTVSKGPVPEPVKDIDVKALVRLYKNETDLGAATLRINDISWNHFDEFIDGKKVTEITVTDLKDFKNRLLLNKAAPATIHIYFRDVNKLLGFAKAKGLIKKNPCKKDDGKWAIDLPPVEDTWTFLTLQEEEKLLSLCNPLLKRMVIVALETGLRISQVIDMDWKRYDSTARLYIVPPQKRQRIRRIPILPRALESMGPLRLGGRVFPGTNKDQIEKMFTRAVKKGWPKKHKDDDPFCTFHDLRHTFVSRVCQYLSPAEVRDLMGWSSVSLVDRYTHSRVTDIQSKMMSRVA